MSSCVCKISFKSVQVCGGYCKMFRGGLTFWDTVYEYSKHVGSPYSRTKIYAARVSRVSSSFRSISAARARPQQQTRRTPLLLLIDGTHTHGRTDRRTLGRFMTLTASCADRAIGNESAPIQLAWRRFSALAVSNAKI